MNAEPSLRLSVIEGRIHPAGMKGAQFSDEYISSIARHFSIDGEKLGRVLFHLENCDKPEIAMVQNPSPNAEVQAACFVSSVWSRSYKLEPISRDEIHRDFHYQCLFTAMRLLAEVGCNMIRVENLMTNCMWKRDAYICLIEAWRNIRKYVNPAVSISLQDCAYDSAMVEGVNCSFNPEGLNDHRPIAMCPYVMEGLNMSRIFLRTQNALVSVCQA
jgi:hypothetical protein